MKKPRGYWSGITDADLIQARDEYRETADLPGMDCTAELRRVADEIDDDLRLRAEWRERHPVTA